MESKLIQILAFLCLSSLVSARYHHNHYEDSSPSKRTVRANFLKDCIVPDGVSTAPEHYLEVVYPTKAVPNFGNELTPTQANNTPYVSWLDDAPKCDQNKYYALFMIDLDPPSRKNPTLRSFVHWVVMNIPGDRVKRGDNVEGYYPPEPPAGTGLHRYTFLAYEQPGRITPPNPWPFQDGGFDMTAFAKQYNLAGPYAGNYFKAQSEEPARL